MAKKPQNDTLAQRLAAKGTRLTRQRRAVLELLENAPAHLHAHDILQQLQQRNENIDRATVYRILAMLKREGLVEELDLLHLEGQGHYYEARLPGAAPEHVHVGCLECGAIREQESELVKKLAAQLARQTGFKIESLRIEAAGRCPACQGKKQPDA